MSEPTHYDVLGVPRTADRETIRKAYIAIARASHPDKQSASAVQREVADRRIRSANAAWNELRDPERRRAYDRSLPDLRPPSAPNGTVRDLQDPRPPPPSGIVVSARTAPFWRWGPVVAAVVLGAVLIIGSAYATSQDSTPPSSATPSVAEVLRVGTCARIVAGPSGKVAQSIPCDQQFASKIEAVVDSPRPCPPSTATVSLYDGKTTLCLVDP